MSSVSAKGKAPESGPTTSPFDKKRRLDLLLLAHTIVAAVCGSLAVLFPHLFGLFLGEGWHGAFLRWNPDDPQVKLTHVIIRLYGALILGQAFIVWHVRHTADGAMRRGIVRAYFVVFSITSLVLLRSHLTDQTWHMSNWVNVLLFTGLAIFYGWFYWFSPPPVFESLDKVVIECPEILFALHVKVQLDERRVVH
eukprot:CAMPEP_0177199948 /NCGR_PEP_ID=MMETSP0367-20130122/25951_1 /TAXON_ID=447022 ORGANISM="Scrippsiella hangoei-like, Strain SHHI-4" /NCGR_SAMPLE_ID=MMETSP0367 /ASSEMBLY_ACC=CAM_ASM_000362 /LENGTH=194 /DNA_ID=CAMNT_0018648341 /DNA_START=58 /DNA_END=643 /DNA_ORIENTATION=-